MDMNNEYENSSPNKQKPSSSSNLRSSSTDIIDDGNDHNKTKTEQLINEIIDLTSRQSEYCLSCSCNKYNNDLLSLMSIEANANMKKRLLFKNLFENLDYIDQRKNLIDSTLLMHNFELLKKFIADDDDDDIVRMIDEQKNRLFFRTPSINTNGNDMNYDFNKNYSFNHDDCDDEESSMKINHHPHCRKCSSITLDSNDQIKQSQRQQQKQWINQMNLSSAHNFNLPVINCSISTMNMLKNYFPNNLIQFLHSIEEANLRINLINNNLNSLSRYGVINDNRNLNEQRLHQYVDLNIFLPYGFFIQLSIENDCTLSEIKHDIWNEFEQVLDNIQKQYKLYSKQNKQKNKRPSMIRSFSGINRVLTNRLSFKRKSSRKSLDNNLLQSSITGSSSSASIKRTISLNEAEGIGKIIDSENDDIDDNENAKNRINVKQLSFNPYNNQQKQIDLFESIDLLNETIFSGNNCDKLNLNLLSFLSNDHCDYAFQSLINTWEEIYDDNSHLYELYNEQMPYYLRLVEITKNNEEKLLNQQIKQLIKCSVNKLEVYRTDEFYDYRFSLYKCMLKAIKQREQFSMDRKISYEFEPELDEIHTLNLSTQTIIKKFHLNELINDEDKIEYNKSDRNNFKSWFEILADYFDHPFPYLAKNRRKNSNTDTDKKLNQLSTRSTMPGAYSPHHGRINIANNIENKNKNESCYQNISNNLNQTNNNNEPLYTEVCIVTSESKDDYENISLRNGNDADNEDHKKSIEFIKSIQYNNPLMTTKASKKFDKHRKNMKIIKNIPKLTPVLEEDEISANKKFLKEYENKENNYFDGIDDETENEESMDIEYSTVNFLNNENNGQMSNHLNQDAQYHTKNIFRKPYKRKFSVKILLSVNIIKKNNRKYSNSHMSDHVNELNGRINDENKETVDGKNQLNHIDDNGDIVNINEKTIMMNILSKDVGDDINNNDNVNDKSNESKKFLKQKNRKKFIENIVNKLSVNKQQQNSKSFKNDSVNNNNNNNYGPINQQSTVNNLKEYINDSNDDESLLSFDLNANSNKNSFNLIQKILFESTTFIEHQKFLNSTPSSSSSSMQSVSTQPSSAATAATTSLLSLNLYQSKLKSIQKNLKQTFTKFNFDENQNQRKIDSNNNNLRNDHTTIFNEYNLNPEFYLLKIYNQNQFLLGNLPLIRYEYIRKCVSIGIQPILQLIKKEDAIYQLSTYKHIEPSFIRRLSQHQIANFKNSMNDAANNKNDENEKKKNRSNIAYNLIDGYSSKERFYYLNSYYNRNNIQLASIENETSIDEIRSNKDYCHYTTITHVMDSQQQEQQQENLINDARNDYQNNKVLNEEKTSTSWTNNFHLESIYDSKSLDSWIHYGLNEKNSLISLWNIKRTYRLKIMSASYVNVKTANKIFVRMAICNGNELLTEIKSTKYVNSNTPSWNQWIKFDNLLTSNLPLSSRLSLELCITNSRRDQDICPIGWVNLPLFNYRHCLLSDRISLILWPMKYFDNNEPINQLDSNSNNNEPLSTQSILSNRLGYIGSNPLKDSAPRLDIEFEHFDYPVVYPPKHEILEYATIVNRREGSLRQMFSQKHSATNMNDRYYRPDSNETKLNQLRKSLSQRDPLNEMSEQEKDFFWRERYILSELCPDALPKIIESVRWINRDEVCQLYALIDQWPIISVDTAIILLGQRYPDPIVRSFAIKCLDVGLTDQLMLHYLLQLVQLITNETYLNNDLTRLLLKRALLNRRFGNRFFWHIRSRLSDQYFGPRWCVLLEMYCRGLPERLLYETLQQVIAFDEIEKISSSTSAISERKQAIIETLRQPNILSMMNGFYNPLNIAIKLDHFDIDSLRVMDSAKRPLWLEWSNMNCSNHFKNSLPNNAIIFKSGDDLRQDILTLQVIRIMDQIWRSENLDLRILSYNCLATGDFVGLIEVVPNAKTIMNIQRDGGRKAALQIDNTKLYKWICEHNKNNENDYNNAIENFTRSCAGYCVATFILGIGDRNPDNIMINKNGQIFHIDFGHFLGHFKKKFGINRERVPFVLTQDFLEVIAKGAENPLKSQEFEAFQRLCNDAYLALHDNAQLIISLFTMMLGTGIPELQTIDDIQYLRQTLQIDSTRDEALQYFEQQLDDAYAGAWSTKLDWFFHSVKHA